MLSVSTIRVLGLFGSTFPKTLRAIPGLKSLVSFESIRNCFTFPCGTPSTALRSGAGVYSGPITKLPSTSSGGFSPVFSTLKGGEPGSSNLRTGACASAGSANKNVQMKNVAHGLDMRNPRVVDSGSSPRMQMLYLLDIRIVRQSHVGYTHRADTPSHPRSQGFRVIAAIHFNREKVFVRHVLTHVEYDEGK